MSDRIFSRVFSCNANIEADVLLLAQLLKFTTTEGGAFRATCTCGCWVVEFHPNGRTSLETMLATAYMVPDGGTMFESMRACPVLHK